MTLTLSPELEQRVRAEAARHGQDAREYALSLLQIALPNEVPPWNASPSLAERLAALDALAKAADPAVPLLPDEALRRETMYED